MNKFTIHKNTQAEITKDGKQIDLRDISFDKFPVNIFIPNCLTKLSQNMETLEYDIDIVYIKININEVQKNINYKELN